MTNPIHPLRTTAHVRDSYLRYLKTIYPFQDRALRDQYWKALEEQDRLVKGPLLEASPPFAIGRSVEQLIRDGVLHQGFRALCSTSLPLHRPLYRHQDEAVEKTVRVGRNIAIATGTGSGKTEGFLIPVLDHLLGQVAGGGVELAGDAEEVPLPAARVRAEAVEGGLPAQGPAGGFRGRGGGAHGAILRRSRAGAT